MGKAEFGENACNYQLNGVGEYGDEAEKDQGVGETRKTFFAHPGLQQDFREKDLDAFRYLVQRDWGRARYGGHRLNQITRSHKKKSNAPHKSKRNQDGLYR